MALAAPGHGERRGRVAQEVPRPTSREMRPCASRSASACRTEERVTPSSMLSCRSVGSGRPTRRPVTCDGPDGSPVLASAPHENSCPACRALCRRCSQTHSAPALLASPTCRAFAPCCLRCLASPTVNQSYQFSYGRTDRWTRNRFATTPPLTHLLVRPMLNQSVRSNQSSHAATDTGGPVRLATIATPSGPRLHVRARSGYVDVAEGRRPGAPARGRPGSGLAMDAIRPLLDRDGREVSRGASSRPRCRAPPRILCLGVNYGEHAHRGRPGRADLARGVRPRRGQRARALRGPGQARADRAVRLRGRARHRHRRRRPVHPRGQGTRRHRRLRGAQRRVGPGLAAGGQPVDREARTSRAACRSAPRWSPPTRWTCRDLAISSTLNGEVMQSARTSQMLVDVPSAVEFFSSFTRLAPGDVIATGTPGGVGFARHAAGLDAAGRRHRGDRRGRRHHPQPHRRRGRASPADWRWHPAAAARRGGL